jgi:mycothiol system anti-sigma-R factor
MNCQDVQKFIHAYLDGEFDEREWATLAAHLEQCSSCRRMAEFEERFRTALKRSLPPVAAPETLRASVGRALDEAEAEEMTPDWTRRWAWRLIPAAAAATLIVAAFFAKQRELTPPNMLAAQSIEWHRLRLPMDVKATSTEAVQRFFSDKVPFAVRPPAFARQARLDGARLANLREHQAVYLTYRVGDSRVSVFIFDPQAVPTAGPVRRVGRRQVYWQDVQGYPVAMYTSGGTGYAVTSDMDPERLVQLIAHSH